VILPMNSHETGKNKKVGTTARVPKSWHAVSVIPKGASCEAAHTMRGKRFLSADAPRLPLVQCTSPKSCTCAYKHYEDRRGNPRRNDEAGGLRKSAKPGEERRISRDRRNNE
jgi:hypothetical protein